jgi:PTH1 family peptidyl-tRNA hydrolase
MSIDLRAIIGLGNPGDGHARDRHNAGYWFADRLAEEHKGTFRKESRFKGQLAEIALGGPKLLLLEPTTYMNHSGEAIQALMAFYKIAPDQLLVAHDELDLPVGTVRLKAGGGHGGHNGLRSVHDCIGPDYRRLRIGIGHPGHKDLVHDYVLSKPPAGDRKLILASIDAAIAAMPVLFEKGWEQAMNQLHAWKPDGN